MTEYRQAQEALCASEQEYRMLFENMSLGFALHEMIYGEDGQAVDSRFIQVNPAFEKLTGYLACDLVGRTVKEIWPSPERRWMDSYSMVAESGQPLSFEQYSDIMHKYFEVRAFSPAPHVVALLFTDITERKRYEIELKAAKEKAEENERLKSAFLANMSHEIRTPMNGILGFADLLKEPELTNEEQQRYITIIEQSGHRLLNIINDLIAISKVESGQMKVFLSETNVNEQLGFIHSFFKLEASKKGIELFLTCPLSNKESEITTDCEKLYAVLTNLMKNAIKFTDTGSISFGYEQRPGLLLFYVNDTGRGIPKELQTIVFERFQQVDIDVSRSYEGAGLGLSISKAYVEMLGGTIWVESEEGKGSQFYFTLPYTG